MTRQIENFIDGKSRPAEEGLWLDLVDPATEEISGRVARSKAEDVALAYASSIEAAREWNRTTPGERSHLLMKLADAIEARADDFVAAESADTGKPRATLKEFEIDTAVEDLRFFAGAARGLEGRASGEYMKGHTSVIRREPIGVVGQIAPWNFPLVMAVWKIGPALAAGNTTVFKPAETTPSSAVLLAEIAAEILGPGVLNVVTGDRETGRALVESPVPGLVSLTGSVRAGRQVAEAAGGQLTRLHLELGGKAPAVVANDVDVKAIVGALAIASFFNAGQDCTAATRLIVHEDRYDEFVEAFVAEAGRIRVGGPFEEGVFYGPLNSLGQLRTVEGFLERLPDHARVLVGGERLDRAGYFFPPTLVADVRQDDEIVQGEVFGPVVTLQRYATDDEALELANGTEYGLAASIWTNDLRRAARFSREMEAGCVWVNCHLPLVPEMPQGGFKQSGYGKDLSGYAVEEYTRIKHVMTFTGNDFVRLDDDGQVAY